MLVQIAQRISIDPMYMDKDIENHILNKLKTSTENTCTYTHGYINKIIRLVKIIDNLVGTPGSSIFFNIIYEAETIRPVNGLVLNGTVCMIFEQGIFVDILNKIKIIIPISFLTDFKYIPSYEKSGPVFVHEKLVITSGININIEIVRTKYEEKQFSCIGKINLNNF